MAILDSYSPTTNDLALTRQVPVANTRRVFDPQSFTTIPNVPVFAEHETTCTAGKYAGRKLTFGYNELLAVSQRCNRRITETGDYATIVIGHTPPRDLIWKGEAKAPELIGFCGPFRMGQIALADGRLRWSILADFHVFREDEKKLRKYPRRSAELWLEEKYDDMFLDPIALLSSEAPRLDMGLLYSRFESGGRNVEIYAAAAGPSASSVFIPAPAKPAKKYQGEETMPFSPEDVQQIVSAIMQTEPMQFVVSLMQQQGDPAGQPPGPPPGPDAGAAPGAPPGPPGPGAPPEPQAMAGADPAGAPPMVPGAPGAGPMMPPGGPPMPGQQPPKPYMADDDDEEYDDEDDAPPMPKPKKKPKPADGDQEQYSLQNAHKRIYSLEQQLAVERYARENTERRSYFLQKQAEGYDCNPDEEMSICGANVMPREQWERYAKHFEKTRSTTALEFSLPAGALPRTGDKMRTVNGRPEVAEYSLEASDRARQVCEAAIARGESVDYETVLRQVVAGQ